MSQMEDELIDGQIYIDLLICVFFLLISFLC